jgi:hypothetical protein
MDSVVKQNCLLSAELQLSCYSSLHEAGIFGLAVLSGSRGRGVRRRVDADDLA